MSDQVADYYPNALCFQDLSKVSLYDNWFNPKFRNIFLAIEACQNTQDNPKKCASYEEIEKFKKENVFYVVKQNTFVNKDIYKHESNPYFNN